MNDHDKLRALPAKLRDEAAAIQCAAPGFEDDYDPACYANRRERDTLNACADELEAALAALGGKGEAPGLRAALEIVLPYARHADSCGDMDAYNNATVESCGCGLDSAKEYAYEALAGATHPEAQPYAEGSVERDMMLYGTAFTVGGKRVDPREVFVHTQPEAQGEAVAWLHQVVGDDGEPDQALSFSRDSFPLEGVAGYKSVSVRPLVYGDTAAPKPVEGDERIAWGAVANAGRCSQTRQQRWAHVMDATGVGSTRAIELCKRFGFDPDEEIPTLTAAQQQEKK